MFLFKIIENWFKCQGVSLENVPINEISDPVTTFAARWIVVLLGKGLSISAIQELTGIHWYTIRTVQKDMMDKALTERKQALRGNGVLPVKRTLNN